MSCGCDGYFDGGCGSDSDATSPMFAVTPYLTLTSTPSGPSTFLTLAEAKQHCRIDIDDDDALLQVYIDAAISYVEGRTGTTLRLTKHVVEYNQFPDGKTPLVAPVDRVDFTQPGIEFKYVTTAGNTVTMDIGNGFDGIPYQVRSVFVPTGVSWPTDALSSTDETPGGVGYHIPPTLTYFTSPDAATSPPPSEAKVATLMLVAHWYTAREPVTTGLNATNNKVPYTVDVLLSASSDITF